MPFKDRSAWAGYMRERRAAKLAEGLCGNCGSQPRDGDLTLCRHCADVQAAGQAARKDRARAELLEHYGPERCACCGEAEPAFLAFDHIDSDGSAHRRELRPNGKGVSLYALCADMKRKGWPPVLQVLCHNCNIGRHLNDGACPHVRGPVTT